MEKVSAGMAVEAEGPQEHSKPQWPIQEHFLQPDGQPDYMRMILTSRVYDVLHETAVDFAPALSERLGHRIYLKREDLTPVFSFKLRGAYNRLANLPDEERWHGVVACSAGTKPRARVR